MTTRRPEQRLHPHPTAQRLKCALLPLLLVLALLGPAPGVAQGQDPDETIAVPGPELVIRAGYTNQDVYVPPPGPGVRLSPQAMDSATFSVTYNGFSPAAQDAFQYAVDIWAGLLDSLETIDVEANWTPLGLGVLGSAGATYLFANFSGAPAADTWFSNALADRRACDDLIPSETEIIANFNSAFPFWYLGTDGATPANQWDFVTVVLHELAHGLGFAGSFVTVDDSSLEGRWDDEDYPGIPAIYTRFMSTGSGLPIISYASPSTALGTALQGGAGGIRATGIHAIAGNGGTQPVMYSPSTWSQGSSFSHFDQSTYAVELMKPILFPQTAIHDPGSRTLGILRDIGWGDELVIQAFGYNTSDSRPEWVQIQNHSSIALTLSDYAMGDEEDRGGAEGMFMLPDVDLAPGGLFTMRVRGTDAWPYSAPDPTYCWNCGGGGYTDLVSYSPWGGTAGNLDDLGDEVVLLRTNGGVADPDGTIDDFIIDAICYGSGQPYVDTDGDLTMNGRDKLIFEGGGCLGLLTSGSYLRADTVENCVPASAHMDNPTAITIASSDVSQAVAADGGTPGAWLLFLALCVTLVALFAHRRRTT